jgi:single-stranded DNA-binding protein
LSYLELDCSKKGQRSELANSQEIPGELRRALSPTEQNELQRRDKSLIVGGSRKYSGGTRSIQKDWRMSIEAAFDGRLGSPPRSRTSAAGKAWTSFSLAVKSDDGTEWINVSAFSKVAAELPSDLVKGERLYVEGRLKVSRWQKDGIECVSLQVAARRILVLDRIGRRRRLRRRQSAGISEDVSLSDGAAAPALADDLIPF